MIGAGVVVLGCEALGVLFLLCIAALAIGWTQYRLRKWQDKG